MYDIINVASTRFKCITFTDLSNYVIYIIYFKKNYFVLK